MKTYTEVITEQGYGMSEDPDGKWIEVSAVQQLKYLTEAVEVLTAILNYPSGDKTLNGDVVAHVRFDVLKNAYEFQQKHLKIE
jgi:hypothetical protein